MVEATCTRLSDPQKDVEIPCKIHVFCLRKRWHSTKLGLKWKLESAARFVPLMQICWSMGIVHTVVVKELHHGHRHHHHLQQPISIETSLPVPRAGEPHFDSTKKNPYGPVLQLKEEELIGDRSCTSHLRGSQVSWRVSNPHTFSLLGRDLCIGCIRFGRVHPAAT